MGWDGLGWDGDREMNNHGAVGQRQRKAGRAINLETDWLSGRLPNCQTAASSDNLLL